MSFNRQVIQTVAGRRNIFWRADSVMEIEKWVKDKIENGSIRLSFAAGRKQTEEKKLLSEEKKHFY